MQIGWKLNTVGSEKPKPPRCLKTHVNSSINNSKPTTCASMKTGLKDFRFGNASPSLVGEQTFGSIIGVVILTVSESLLSAKFSLWCSTLDSANLVPFTNRTELSTTAAVSGNQKKNFIRKRKHRTKKSWNTTIINRRLKLSHMVLRVWLWTLSIWEKKETRFFWVNYYIVNISLFIYCVG